MSSIQELNHWTIPLKDIISATNNFSDDNFIGKGGFGRVYKGQLPLSGDRNTTVAVKRLDVKGGQGQHEFLMEIIMLASYKHRNLVTLVGFSDVEDHKIIVYEHVARGSLDKYLASTELTWVQRLQICLGAARGLDFLHNGVAEGHRVLHRDIKSSNILLDENWEAKISDFGLSKIGPANQQFTFVATYACGTMGYVDPEYVSSGVLTKESDVYSFGVVLFEVLCGRLVTTGNYNDGQPFLSHLAKQCYKEKRLDEIIFPSLRQQMNPNSLRRYSSIAYRCLERTRSKRPKMGSIIEELQLALDFQIDGRIIKQTRLWGTPLGGAPWSWKLESNDKLRKITIDHKDWIYSITFTIEDSKGSLRSSPQYGGGGGSSGEELVEINFDADEEIVEILGTVGESTLTHNCGAGLTVISSLCFVTNKKRHGPFGKEGSRTFSVACDIGSFAGFHGRSGFYLDALGCYLKESVSEPSVYIE